MDEARATGSARDASGEDAVETLLAEVARLRAENAHLKEELRLARRDQHETPPHYL